jgi:hypothetical protein
MKKIGIVSFYRGISIGSALQACALQMTLRKLGYRCEHIRYVPGIGRKRKYFEQIKNYFNVLRRFIYPFKRMRYNPKQLRQLNFDMFIYHKIRESKIVYRREDLYKANKVYDAVICGSDQIWAPNLFDEWYYINFIPDKHKKIAYAPSIGLPQIPNDLKEHIAVLIKSIGFLSIREQEGAQLVYELTGIKVPVVLDPTFLVDKNTWLSKIKNYELPKTPYILCFFLGTDQQHRKAVKTYQKKTGFKIVVLPFVTHDYAWGDAILNDAGPLEFLDLVNNAAVIFTDSFHGAVFSIIFNKPFFVFMRFAEDHAVCQNSRIRNILTILKLEKRLIHDGADIQYTNNEIDYTAVNKILEQERVKSLDYLQNALKNSTKKLK